MDTVCQKQNIEKIVNIWVKENIRRWPEEKVPDVRKVCQLCTGLVM